MDYIGEQTCKRKLRVLHAEKSDTKSSFLKIWIKNYQGRNLVDKMGCTNGTVKKQWFLHRAWLGFRTSFCSSRLVPCFSLHKALNSLGSLCLMCETRVMELKGHFQLERQMMYGFLGKKKKSRVRVREKKMILEGLTMMVFLYMTES